MTDSVHTSKLANSLAKRYANLIGQDLVSLEEIKSGANTLVYKLNHRDKVVLLKKYREDGNRNRISREVNFLTQCKTRCIKNVPNLIYFDKEENFSILEWIEGRQLKKAIPSDWSSIANFLISIQPDSKDLSMMCCASDAYFTVSEHWNRVNNLYLESLNKNVGLLAQYNILEKLNKLHKDAQEYVNGYFGNGNHAIEKNSIAILSPSDVGFHNVIKSKGRNYFIDFEYAGKDDPYKLLSDLLIHPDWIPTKSDSQSLFCILKALFNEENNQISFPRLSVMMRIYQLKWVVIMLKNSRNYPNEELMLKIKDYITNAQLRLNCTCII